MVEKCEGCQTSSALDFDFTMAFQPIYDVRVGRVWGYEALVRGTNNEGAFHVLGQVRAEQKYRFDQACRVKAIELAARLFPPESALQLSINFMPNAVYEPAACLRATLTAARKENFPLQQVMFEFTENEEIVDTGHLQRIIAEYRKRGFLTALDDFGAGYAGLCLLADFQPDLIKLDMHLIRGCDTNAARITIIAAMVTVARELGIQVLAEGVETEQEFDILRAAGIKLFQGYWFAKPAFESLPPIALVDLDDRQRQALVA